MRGHRACGGVGAVVAAALLASCGGAGGSETDGPPSPRLPPANGTFDYQIGGPYSPAPGVAVVDRDRSDPPVAGKYNVCYLNAFQTQQAEEDVWRRDHPDLLLADGGILVRDPDWPEILLDVSTAEKRARLAAIVGTWIDGCAANGFDAVEPDNLDSWTRSHGLLTMEDNVAFAALLAERAHAAGLAFAQKNTPEVLPDRGRIGFDFAVVEECQVWDECDGFSDAYGARWYEIEYSDAGRESFDAACRARGESVSIIYRDRDVVPAGSAAYVYESC